MGIEVGIFEGSKGRKFVGNEENNRWRDGFRGKVERHMGNFV